MSTAVQLHYYRQKEPLAVSERDALSGGLDSPLRSITSGFPEIASADAAHRTSSRDLPSLDGLRAISIACVILGHGGQDSASPIVRILLSRLSQFGVCIFFVISGYLITSLLWREAESRGTINLSRFYFRRTLRIFPPYYAYIAFVGLGAALRIWIVPEDARWWPAVTYTSDIFPTHFWLLSHGWSLSIEEQFYLTWPIILATCIRFRGRSSGSQIGLRIALVAMACFPLLRVLVYWLSRDGMLAEAIIFDYVAAGSAMALFQSAGTWELGRQGLRTVLGSRLTPIAAILALALHLMFAAGMRWVFAIGIVLSIPVEAILLAIFVAWTVRNPAHVLGRILNLRVMRVVGIGSYSLYLWQQIFFGSASPFSERLPIEIRFLGAALCAAGSYFIIERPSLRLRARIETRVFAEGS
jgi:peptidoglycan/LPS O-acetylase OafA/YrhL